MEIPVLVEPVAGNGYVAKTGEPFAMRAEGTTEDEAIEKLKRELKSRMSNGTKVVNIELTVPPHPLAKFAGMFENDPAIEDWEKDVAEYRRKVDMDSDRP